ncbi:MAG: DNA-protecting protein DprA [Candidatus Liptonbacteria bacterium]|nr:DNA-protecting protein DprA [Candidatus Liptonbacteria bacterium]
MPSEEHLFLNAVATACEGEYSRLKKLYEEHHTWSTAWEAIRTKYPKINPQAAWEKLEKTNTHLLLPSDSEFPPLLKEIPFPPFALYYRGHLPAPPPALAIVGTRKATQNGRLLAETLAGELAGTFTIVSGLALGIDAAAHTGCLKNNGLTFAVLAGGVEAPHPRTNESLANQILEKGGALLSEYPLGITPLPRRFLERNRLVSGLSQGIVVIEAPEESGALATARFALDQNREVFVVPGPVTHPNFRGSHSLLRKGARPVRSTADILEDLEMSPAPKVNPLFTASLGKVEQALLEALKSSPQGLSVDILAEKTDTEVMAVNRALSFLLLENMVQETEDGYTLRA